MILETQFREAVDEIEHALYHIKQRLHDDGWRYEVVSEAPETYQDLLQHYKKHGRHLLVFGGASDQTIFSDPKYNHVLRFWHDVVHLMSGLDFSLEDEMEVARCQVRHLRYFYEASELAQHILWADLAGQRKYYAVQGEHCVNQAAFVNSCVQRGIRVACMAKH